MNLQPDQLICRDKYRLICFLGKGGYGEVWLAEERASRSQKAIKIAHQNAEALQRFNREKQLSSQLDHANLVVTHTVEQDGDTAYMVMPYMAGGNLADKLKQGPLPLLEAVQIAAQIAAGLGHLHRKDWIHRDVHPGNILFNGEGVARLSDFGLMQTPETSAALWYGAQTERHPGNLCYQPPETIGQAGRPLTPLYAASDVYMLGAVLWEMVTGKSYYHHKNKPLHQLRPDAPDWLAKLLAQCLSPVAEIRPQDGNEMAQKLRDGAPRITQQLQREKIELAIKHQEWRKAEQLLATLKLLEANDTLKNELQQSLTNAKINHTKELWHQAEHNLASDPQRTLDSIAQIRALSPEYLGLDKLEKKAKRSLLKQRQGFLPLTAWNPLDWLRLIWWVLVTPQTYQRYRDIYGQESLDRHMAWLLSSLTHLSWLLFWLWGTAQPLHPEVGEFSLWLLTHGGWVFLAIGISWLLTGWMGHYKWVGHYKEDAVYFVAFGVAFIVAFIVAFVVVFDVAFVIAFVVAFVVVFGVASVVAGAVAFGVAFGVAGGVTAGVTFGVAVSIAFGVVFGVVFGVAEVVAKNIKNGRSSPWALALLIAAYGVMVWQVVAAWLA